MKTFFWMVNFIFFNLIQMLEMRLSIEGMEKERDFYFGKLRDIEVVVQEYSDTDDTFASKILDVLYATEVMIAKKTKIKITIPFVLTGGICCS